MLSKDRKEEGGGLLIYVKDEIKCVRRKDLETDEVECLFLEISPKNGKSFLVGNLYRNSKETVKWNENLENIMENVLQEEKETYILGDVNRDLLNENSKKSWLEYMEQFGLLQKVMQATRETETSRTLIDHLYLNTSENLANVTVPKIGLSDHYPIFMTRKMNFSTSKREHYTIKYRSFKNFNETNFKEDMSSVPWDIIKGFEEPDEILETWSDLFLKVVDSHLPMKQHRVKHKQQPKWLSPEILDAMKTRDRYKSINNDQQYKIWQNKVTKLIENSKKQKYKAFIEENNNKPASVWKIFKELGATKNKT